MEYWNYRILARKVSNEVLYEIYEVHYDENDIPVACTENPVSPLSVGDADPIKSLKWVLNAMKLATEKPILDYHNFPGEYLPYSRKKKLEAIKKYLK